MSRCNDSPILVITPLDPVELTTKNDILLDFLNPDSNLNYNWCAISKWYFTKLSIGERMMLPTTIPFSVTTSSKTFLKLYPTEPMQLKVYF